MCNTWRRTQAAPVNAATAYPAVSKGDDRREDVDGTHWEYDYDELHQLTSADRFHTDGGLLQGQGFRYGYDDIGNRLFREMTSTGPESAGLIEPQRETRSSSLRNLVTNQSNPSSKSILGKADAAALITVNASPGEGGGVANRHTDRWARDIDTANASGAIWQPTDVLSSLNGSLAREQGVVLAEPAQQDFVYDSDGSLLDDGTRQFGWNAQGQCVTQSLANVTNAPATHPVSATHVYDWMGRRAISTFTRADGSTGQLLTVFDRYDPILEEDETGKQQAHVWGINRQGQGNGATLGSTLLWSITSTDSRTLFAKTDASGNVNAWYDEQQSQVAARTYSPFGEVLEESGEEWPVSFGFSTKREFGGLNDYGFRWYRAEFGAWLSSDPILENGGLNLQVVVGNSVINYEDILGLRPPSPQEAGAPVGYFTYPHGATPDQMAHIDHINQQNAGKPTHSHVRPWPSIMNPVDPPAPPGPPCLARACPEKPVFQNDQTLTDLS